MPWQSAGAAPHGQGFANSFARAALEARFNTGKASPSPVPPVGLCASSFARATRGVLCQQPVENVARPPRLGKNTGEGQA